jgi:hypothetical protein
MDEATKIQLFSLRLSGTSLIWWESKMQVDIVQKGKVISSRFYWKFGSRIWYCFTRIKFIHLLCHVWCIGNYFIHHNCSDASLEWNYTSTKTTNWRLEHLALFWSWEGQISSKLHFRSSKIPIGNLVIPYLAKQNFHNKYLVVKSRNKNTQAGMVYAMKDIGDTMSLITSVIWIRSSMVGNQWPTI